MNTEKPTEDKLSMEAESIKSGIEKYLELALTRITKLERELHLAKNPFGVRQKVVEIKCIAHPPQFRFCEKDVARGQYHDTDTSDWGYKLTTFQRDAEAAAPIAAANDAALAANIAAFDQIINLIRAFGIPTTFQKAVKSKRRTQFQQYENVTAEWFSGLMANRPTSPYTSANLLKTIETVQQSYAAGRKAEADAKAKREREKQDREAAEARANELERLRSENQKLAQQAAEAERLRTLAVQLGLDPNTATAETVAALAASKMASDGTSRAFRLTENSPESLTSQSAAGV